MGALLNDGGEVNFHELAVLKDEIPGPSQFFQEILISDRKTDQVLLAICVMVVATIIFGEAPGAISIDKLYNLGY